MSPKRERDEQHRGGWLEKQLAFWIGSVIRIEMVKEWKRIEFERVERGVLRVDIHMEMRPPSPPLGR
jgi:hypothetical protein